MEKHITSSATKMSLNDRFTMLASTKQKSIFVISDRQNRNKSKSVYSQTRPNICTGSVKNCELVEDFERKLKVKLAMRLKPKIIHEYHGIRRETGKIHNAVQRHIVQRHDPLRTQFTKKTLPEVVRRSNSTSSVYSRLGNNVKTQRRRMRRTSSIVKVESKRSIYGRQHSISRGRQSSTSNIKFQPLRGNRNKSNSINEKAATTKKNQTKKI